MVRTRLGAAALAGPPGTGLPTGWWVAGWKPPRKVQLAVRAEGRVVTKAVLRAGKSRERKADGAWTWPPRTLAVGAWHLAQGHVATASR